MDYRQNILKQYDNWTLFLHENQSYLGRCYIWYAHDNPVDMFDADCINLKELYDIMREIKRAISKCFSPDMYNYASLNNLIRHLHCHLVPRYNRKVTFNGVMFEDNNWGGNYAPYPHDFILPQDTMKTIREYIQSELKCEVEI